MGKIQFGATWAAPQQAGQKWILLFYTELDTQRGTHTDCQKTDEQKERHKRTGNHEYRPTHKQTNRQNLNPVEMFWGWMRQKLRKMDLDDLKAKRPLLKKPGYIARINSICCTEKAQRIAKAFDRKFRSFCQQVVRRKGAAADN